MSSSAKIIEEKSSFDSEKDTPKNDAPVDRFKAVFVLFFLCGSMQYFPVSFVLPAHDYWMYKFRTPSEPTYDPNNLSSLEKNFGTVHGIVLQTLTIVTTTILLFFGHKISFRSKLYGAPILIVIMYLILILFVEINTDQWQIIFFVITMVIVSILSFSCFVFAMHVFTILAQFPGHFLTPYVTGQSFATMISAVLQILTLSIGLKSTKNALFFFLIGVSIIALIIMYIAFIEKQNRFYKYHMQTYLAIRKPSSIELKRVKGLMKKLYPAFLNILGYLLTLEPLSPACTSIIGSVNQGNGNAWNDTYFIPVVGFLLVAVGDFIGRIIASKLRNVMNMKAVICFSFLRILIFWPLITLCNIPNKKHLPIVFDEDYQYILIMIAFSISGGFSIACTTFMVPKLVAPDEMEDGLRVFMVSTGVFLTGASYLGLITVNII